MNTVTIVSLVGLLLLDIKIKSQASNCQRLSIDLAKKLPGWEVLMSHAKSKWGDFEEVHVNWDKYVISQQTNQTKYFYFQILIINILYREPTITEDAKICAQVEKADWKFEKLTAKTCQHLDSSAALQNNNNTARQVHFHYHESRLCLIQTKFIKCTRSSSYLGRIPIYSYIHYIGRARLWSWNDCMGWCRYTIRSWGVCLSQCRFPIKLLTGPGKVVNLSRPATFSDG